VKKAALILAAALLSLPAHAHAQAQAQAPAQPQASTVAEFLARVQAMISSGQTSPDSPGMLRLREEVAAAGREIRARQQAEQAAGTPPTLCIPEQGTASNDLLTFLAAIPADRRNMPFIEGFANYVRSKYPCPRS
jgi:hypothetical protein